MRAIEVEKWRNISGRKGKPGHRQRYGSTWHFLNQADATRTLCGKQRTTLQPTVAEHDVDELPELHACRGCVRAMGDWAKKATKWGEGDEPIRYIANPSSGRISRVGPLSHGLRRPRGSRLG